MVYFQIGVTGGFVYEQSILLLPRDNPPITDTYAQYIGGQSRSNGGFII